MPRKPARYIPHRQTTVYIVTARYAVELVYIRWKPTARRWSPGPFASYGDGVSSLGKRGYPMPKRPTGNGTEGLSLPPHADPGKWVEQYPTLAGYLTDPTWDDGKMRMPARVFITPARGDWEFTLKEPNLGLLLVVVCSYPEMGFEILEAALNSPQPPWRPDQWAPKAKPKTKS